jgi:hypothetical protein
MRNLKSRSSSSSRSALLFRLCYYLSSLICSLIAYTHLAAIIHSRLLYDAYLLLLTTSANSVLG